MFRKINNILDVLDWNMCIGCGTCYAACTKNAVELVNIEAIGIRPWFDASICASCTDCLSVCPGYQVYAEMATQSDGRSCEGDEEFGFFSEIWEGHATNPDIRYQGSSGGVLSALALYCLDHEKMDFVLHSGMDPDRPWLNRTVQSRNRRDILERSGSRYAPASPCEGLGLIEKNNDPCVFIGKPCDTAGAFMLRKQRPDLDRNLGLVMSFFCGGTPSTQGTINLLQSLKIRPEDLSTLRYRGEGWPGTFKAINKKSKEEQSIPYRIAWARLCKYRPWRCHICPHGLGRVADISCGDAWHRSCQGDEGRSLIIVRTQRGRNILQRAVNAKYVTLNPADAQDVLVAEKSLLERRRHLFGRLLVMRMLRIPTPNFLDFHLRQSWIKLPLQIKMRSILGTLRRLIHRNLWRRGFINHQMKTDK
ncbi:Coenzyme F420 hydrogenase/dehydrogenase, beta subunit C-terminal domain [Thermodesulfobacteriota bacterium]